MNIYYLLENLSNEDCYTPDYVLIICLVMSCIFIFIGIYILKYTKIYVEFEEVDLYISLSMVSFLIGIILLLFVISEKGRNNKYIKTEKQILEKYNENIYLFDNRKTDDIKEMKDTINKKFNEYQDEVSKSINIVSIKLQEKDIYLTKNELKPFAELYVMDKNNIPVLEPVEQKLETQKTGEVCKILEIKDCFNNSKFKEE